MCLSTTLRKIVVRKTGKFRDETQTNTVTRVHPKTVVEVVYIEKVVSLPCGGNTSKWEPVARSRVVMCKTQKQVTKTVRVPVTETIDLSRVPYSKGRRFFWKRVSIYVNAQNRLGIYGPIMNNRYGIGWMKAKGSNKGIDGGFHVMTHKTRRLDGTGNDWVRVEVDPKTFLRSGHWAGQQCETYGRMRIPASEQARLKKKHCS